MPGETMRELSGECRVGLGWVEAFGDRLYGYALRRVGRRDVAEDLVQETLLAGVRGWPTFDGRAETGTWLTGILRHKVADHLRARYRDAGRSGGSLDAQGQLRVEEDQVFDRRGRWRSPVKAWPRGDPHRLAEGRAFRLAIDGCLAKLPRRMAVLFLGRVEERGSTAELCAELGIGPENAWALMHRARLRLRECLTVNWFTADDPPVRDR